MDYKALVDVMRSISDCLISGNDYECCAATVKADQNKLFEIHSNVKAKLPEPFGAWSGLTSRAR
jgi:hypothetical protein